MPKILVVSATAAEIAPFLLEQEISVDELPGQFIASAVSDEIFVLITGVGMVNTAFELGKLIGSHFDLVINAGVAGSFNKFAVGQVVNVTQDCFCELGAEDDSRFMSIDELGLGTQHVTLEHPFENAHTSKIPKTNGITVNTVHGNEISISKVTERFQPHVESMEGAAFLHAANNFNWKALQLRAISNLVEKRDRSNWNMELAVNNLNDTVKTVIRSLSK